MSEIQVIVVGDESRNDNGSTPAEIKPVSEGPTTPCMCPSLAEATLESLLAGIDQQGQPWRSENPSIFRAHAKIRDVEQDNFEPKIISFGPYHHGKPKYEAMEKIKLEYLKTFLCRKPGLEVRHCVEAVKEIEKPIRSAYSEVIDMSSDEFVKMMVLDGCFIVEFLIGWFGEQSHSAQSLPRRWDDSVRRSRGQLDDQISFIHLNARQIFRDLLLLENQLPFSLLRNLYLLICPEGNLCKIAICFLFYVYDFLTLFPVRKTLTEQYLMKIFDNPIYFSSLHLLHLLQNIIINDSLGIESPAQNNVQVLCQSKLYSIIGWMNKTLSFVAKNFTIAQTKNNTPARNVQRTSPLSNGSTSDSQLKNIKTSFEKMCNEFLELKTKDSLLHKTIPSVTELKDAGVKFKAKEGSRVLVNVTFRDGTVEIPKLYVFKSAPLLLWNLVTFEQCCTGLVTYKVSTYVMFMSCLLSKADDVLILKQKEVIKHSLGNDENVASLFHQIGREVRMKFLEDYLLDVIEDINKYNNAVEHKWFNKLRRDYFGNPWMIISFVVASVILIILFGRTTLGVVEFVQRQHRHGE